MLIELAMVGYLKCTLVKNIINRDTRMCFYQCVDSSRDYARTQTYYQCPNTLYVDRDPLLFKDQDWKNNRWTKKEIERMKQ